VRERIGENNRLQLYYTIERYPGLSLSYPSYLDLVSLINSKHFESKCNLSHVVAFAALVSGGGQWSESLITLDA